MQLCLLYVSLQMCLACVVRVCVCVRVRVCMRVCMRVHVRLQVYVGCFKFKHVIA